MLSMMMVTPNRQSPFAELRDELLMRGLGGSPVPAGVWLESVSHLGVLVRRQRRVLNLSQSQLAARAGVGRRFVSDLERGKGTVRSAELFAVCSAANLVLSVRPLQQKSV